MEDAIFRAHVHRIYPTPAQELALTQWIGSVRYLYNLALEQRQTFGRPGRRFDFVTQGRELTELRAGSSWLADAPRVCLDQALRDLHSAYQHWWSGTSGSPTRRKRGVNDTIRFPKPKDLRLRRTSKRYGCVRVPKIGEIRLRWNREPRGELRYVTIIRRAGQWFASCAFRRGAVPPRASAGGAIGIDRGIRVFAALSNGELIGGPNIGRKAAKSLARAQRRLARKQKGSRNRDKQRLRVAKLHLRVVNARKDFLHRISTQIAKNHGVVVLEDLKVGNMTRRAHGLGRRAKSGLNRAILDQGWGAFRRLLGYKLAERGGELILVSPRNTSRTCSACGALDGASRAGARFSCTACGHTDDADLNAATNILNRGRASVLPVEASPTKAADEAGTHRRAA